MKLKVSDTEIKRKIYYNYIFDRGIDIFEGNLVKNLTFILDKESVKTYQVEGDVGGSRPMPYRVTTAFNHSGEFFSGTCTCPAFKKYSGYCKHIAAVLIKIQHIQESKQSIVWHDMKEAREEQHMIDLVNFYESSIRVGSQDLSMFQKVKLIPKLKLNKDEINLEATIGISRQYVIKDLVEFVRHVENKTEQTYGKELTFKHDLSQFDKESLKVLEFIKEVVTDQQMVVSRFNSYLTNKRYLYLSEPKVKQFFELYVNKTINVTIEGKSVQSLLLTRQSPDIKLVLAPTKEGFSLKPSLPFFDLINVGMSYYLLTSEKLYELDEETKQNLAPLLTRLLKTEGILRIKESLAPSFLSAVLPRVSQYVEDESLRYLEKKFDITPLESRVYLDVNDDRSILAKVEYHYGEVIFNPFDKNEPTYLIRDKIKEAHLETIFDSYSFINANGELKLTDDEEIYHFMKIGVADLMKQHEVHATEGFKSLTQKQQKQVQVGVRLESDLMTFRLENLAFDLSEYQAILAQYKLKRKYYRLKNGAFLELDSEYINSFFNLVEDLELSEEDLRQEEIRLSKYRALYLDRLLSQSDVKSRQNRAFKQLVNDFKQIEEVEYELPKQLQATLRPYQEIGYRWLKTLSDYQMGGILADDMGLGKTLQVITLLCSQKENEGCKPSIIVTPSSLVYNWKAEFEKFAPYLSVLIVSGNASERQEKIATLQDFDVVVTSYDSLRRDIEQYESVEFEYGILDEAHYIKNQGTLNAKTVKKLKANVRFALTGTPLENSIADVWSIFDFILPGYLLSYSKFKKQYETPITKNKDEKLLARVHKLVAPFILRRLKKDVLTELPDKIESVVYCELEREQKAVYEATLVSMNKELQAEILESGENQNRMKMLAMLTRLRQLCCHPSLYLENYEHGSAKLNLCLELVQESIESGHRILLFSQFTSMFELIGEQLHELGIPYFVLTGETKSQERIDLVNRFNAGEVPLFLISLKAGGTGLNLTGADTVIHYDPWWNMSAQNQATDRAYRIGQNNKVQVYKLITKDTIEEKIEKLQQRKLALSDSLVKEGETFITHLSAEDIQDLFQS